MDIAYQNHMAEKNSRSFTDIVKTYGSQLLRFVKGRVKKTEDAEDILQEVWYQFSRLTNMDELENAGRSPQPAQQHGGDGREEHEDDQADDQGAHEGHDAGEHGAHGLRMDAARGIAFALRVGLSESVEDIGHRQGSLRRCGSSMPPARLSCM